MSLKQLRIIWCNFYCGRQKTICS